jgi:ADP-ribosyl-[dinitrogen reductase] hydrolase
MNDVVRAAVYGHLIGDAIGVPYEFSAPDPNRVVKLRGYGTHNQSPGTWSDDGALMLALLDSLVSVGFDPEDQARRALAWADEGRYAVGGVVFDIGNTTSAALARLRAGVPAMDAGGTGERDQGNGSLMRILPVALVGVPDNDVELVRRAHHASRVTHGHPSCEVACALYVLVARTLIEHPGGDPEAALALAADRLREVYRRDAAFASMLGALLAHRSSVRKPGGGWVLDSFWSAWEAFVAGSSYRDTIERAVRYGNDTDTTAAIAGGLAGIRWGLDEGSGGIPRKWLDALRGRDIVEGLLGGLLQ